MTEAFVVGFPLVSSFYFFYFILLPERYFGLKCKRKVCCCCLDCEWKMKAGNSCAASFDWNCSGVCTPEERMDEVHRLCGEEDKDALWNITF